MSGDENLLEILRLHNKEDVEGMLKLLPLFSIRTLWTGNCHEFITCTHTPEENLLLSVQPEHPFPVSFEKELPHVVLRVTPQKLLLEIRPEAGCKKFFYPNYKDYYYLTTEDVAVHKSVAHYVDTKYRKQATASTCYEKHTGEFLPVKDSTDFKYLFKEEYKDKYQFIKADSINDETIKVYVNSIIDFIKVKPK